MRAQLRARNAAVAAVAVALCACACAGVAGPAPATLRFRGVRSLALVRSTEGREARVKDPLDGLEETLRERGFETRVVELGGHPPPEQAALERLFRRLEARASAGRGDRLAAPVREAGAEAAEVVRQLGVDALVTYHPLDGAHAPPPLPPPPFAGPGVGTAAPSLRRPLGALVLVDRSGNAATFAWGDAGFEDPGAPLNAAEAIEQLVRALTGEEPE